MSRNQKLTPLLRGRDVAAVEPPARNAPAPASRFAPSQGTTWHVHFGDGSTLAVRTDGTPPEGLDRAEHTAVTDVSQRGTTLTLTLGAAASTSTSAAPAAPAGTVAPHTPPALVFRTAEPAACVMLRDAEGRMEYAD